MAQFVRMVLRSQSSEARLDCSVVGERGDAQRAVKVAADLDIMERVVEGVEEVAGYY